LNHLFASAERELDPGARDEDRGAQALHLTLVPEGGDELRLAADGAGAGRAKGVPDWTEVRVLSREALPDAPRAGPRDPT
jgi:hypothetical protein